MSKRNDCAPLLWFALTILAVFAIDYGLNYKAEAGTLRQARTEFVQLADGTLCVVIDRSRINCPKGMTARCAFRERVGESCLQ